MSFMRKILSKDSVTTEKIKKEVVTKNTHRQEITRMTNSYYLLECGHKRKVQDSRLSKDKLSVHCGKCACDFYREKRKVLPES